MRTRNRHGTRWIPLPSIPLCLLDKSGPEKDLRMLAIGLAIVLLPFLPFAKERLPTALLSIAHCADLALTLSTISPPCVQVPGALTMEAQTRGNILSVKKEPPFCQRTHKGRRLCYRALLAPPQQLATPSNARGCRLRDHPHAL
ncbi:hypothetical protein BJ138DRAFT_1120126 [Hygrophoropsis aurantiaca]|uniref:Uncharacterized protein n=1 Tax=Hygrophoropsis aurantiaca TaxID=72124 RepID=A0ACB7ZR76_9AGAM|nr:hypothetical protein BJ138DRAFT_1120126 [Hygrophoropsis aurantiaca]